MYTKKKQTMTSSLLSLSVISDSDESPPHPMSGSDVESVRSLSALPTPTPPTASTDATDASDSADPEAGEWENVHHTPVSSSEEEPLSPLLLPPPLWANMRAGNRDDSTRHQAMLPTPGSDGSRVASDSEDRDDSTRRQVMRQTPETDDGGSDSEDRKMPPPSPPSPNSGLAQGDNDEDVSFDSEDGSFDNVYVKLEGLEALFRDGDISEEVYVRTKEHLERQLDELVSMQQGQPDED